MKIQYLFVLLVLCTVSWAVTAEQYCKPQVTPCIKECCPDIDGTWNEATQDCEYPEKEGEILEDMLNGPCGSCANQLMDCMYAYEQAQQGSEEEPTYQPTTPPPRESSSSSCCGSAALLMMVGCAVFLRR